MSVRPDSDLPPAPSDPAPAAGDGASGPDADVLIPLVADIAGELRSGEPAPRIDLDTDLVRDLGLDSLARMELLARLERAAGASLPDRVLAEAETPRDLLRAFDSLRSAASGRKREDAGARPEPEDGRDPGRSGAAAGSTWAAPARRAAFAPRSDAIPAHAETLVEALAWHAAEHSEREHVRLVDESESESVLTFGALLEGARQVAAGLVRSRLTPGRAVAIMLPTGFDYLRCFIGIQLAGGVPPPIYPPARLAGLGVWTVGLDVAAPATVYEMGVAAEAVALVVGSEGRGLSRLSRQRCDVVAAIPLSGRLSSLNAAAAVAVGCFEIARHRPPARSEGP